MKKILPTPPVHSSLSMLVPMGTQLTLDGSGVYQPHWMHHMFTERHNITALMSNGWNLSEYTRGRFQIYQLQRHATANEILASLHGIGVAFLPGSVTALIQQNHRSTQPFKFPLMAFPAVVQHNLPLRRMLYLAEDNSSGSDEATKDKLMISGYLDANPVATLYQPGLCLLTCCERFNDHP